jgi:hypothetical protein
VITFMKLAIVRRSFTGYASRVADTLNASRLRGIRGAADAFGWQRTIGGAVSLLRSTVRIHRQNAGGEAVSACRNA